MLRYQGEKMSKSLRNLVLVGDLLRRYDSDSIRSYCSGIITANRGSTRPDQLEDAAGWAQRLRQKGPRLRGRQGREPDGACGGPRR